MTSRRIVLVEDDDSLRQIAQMTLESLGRHTVLALDSGAEAVRQAAAFAPDLLVLDVTMPGMDGPTTLRHLRAQEALRDTPAVFLTANTQAAQVAVYRNLGAVDVIAKPFDPHELCERVDAVFASAPAAAAREGARRALVIEDDPGIQYLLRFVLEQQGWAVHEARDGASGFEAFAGDPTDAVVLDIMLPGIDGLQLLERLRRDARWNAVPVMMLSAKGDESSVNRALSLGADDYLVKPFDPQELAERIGRLRRVTPSP